VLRRRLSAWAVLLVALVAMAPVGSMWPQLGAALGRPRLISREELALHDGSRPGEAIWLAVCGQARAARRERRGSSPFLTPHCRLRCLT
jgi:hypothetical protein